jgi:hypothetical protein
VAAQQRRKISSRDELTTPDGGRRDGTVMFSKLLAAATVSENWNGFSFSVNWNDLLVFGS